MDEYTEATYNGRTYHIPSLWLAGYTAAGADGRSRTYADGVAWWAWLEECEEERLEILRKSVDA